jgi:uncharacterized protein (DUF488 family)
MPIFTLGHSTRPIEQFLGLLASHGVQRLVDVRTVPRSRHNPQFNADALAASLAGAGVAYLHVPGLGGLRRPRRDSVNTGWRNESFRGYADYMQTQPFADALQQVLGFAARERLALMCAEAVPWRCHRSLVADALVVRGIEVLEITGPTTARAHALTPWAKVEGTTISYPG